MKLNPSKISSTVALAILFIMLNNLMGCEKECFISQPNVTTEVLEVLPHQATIRIKGTLGDDPFYSTTGEIGCSDQCETTPCLIHTLNLLLSPYVLGGQPSLSFQPTNHLDQTFTLSNLDPGTNYTLTVSSYTSLCFPSQTIEFNTPQEECIPQSCSEHGTFDASNCECDCLEGWTGANCDTSVESEDPPTNLIYVPDTLTITNIGAFDSEEPTVRGTPPFIFGIADISPANNAISINSTTGIIQTTGIYENGAGTWSVDVSVSNGAGNTTFEDAYTIIVENPPSGGLPANLVYDPDTLVITSTTGDLMSVQPTIEGNTPMNFGIANVTSPDGGPGLTAIGIDATTGVIRTIGILEFGLVNATYSVDVAVANDAGSVTFQEVYTITVDIE